MRLGRVLVLSAVVLLRAGAVWGAPLPRVPQEAREQLADFARKVLSGEVTAVTPAMMAQMHPALRAPAGEHLFVTIFHDRAPAIRFTAQKTGLVEATFAAMGRARMLPSFDFYHYDDAGRVTLLFERVIDRQVVPPRRWIADLSFLNLGVDGVALRQEATTVVDAVTGKPVVYPPREGSLPPGEVFLYDLRTRDDFISRLCTGLKLYARQPTVRPPDGLLWDKARTRVEILNFESFLSRGPGYSVVDLYRMSDLAVEPWKDRLAAARWMGDAIVRTQTADGRFFTRYNARVGRYTYLRANIMDHCMTLLTLCDLAAATGDKRYLGAAGKGVAYLKSQFLAQTPPGGQPFLCVVHDQEAKLGAAAMAVVALDRYASLTGGVFHDEDMRLLGRFLVHQQYDDGSFHHYYRYDPKVPFHERLTHSFPGQATWALALLEKRFGGGTWHAPAVKAADYLVTKREEQMHWGETPVDPWLAGALREMCTPFAVAGYIDYAKKMAEQAVKRQKTAGAPDMVGSFEGEPEGSVTGAALAARVLGETAEFVEMPADRRDAQLETMRRAVAFIRLNELRPNNTFYLSDPERAYGLVRVGSFDDDVRIDTACYVIQALLALDRMEKRGAEK